MLSAFTARPIVELKPRDKSKIESILAYGDRLVVGLNTGNLRVYRVNELPDEKYYASESEQKSNIFPTSRPIDLLREVEKFSTKTIEQLAIIKESNILISLSNSYVSIYDLNSLTLLEQLTKTKGASTFATTSNIVKDPSAGIPEIISRLAVSVKRKLLIWSWHESEMEQDVFEILLTEPIRTLQWVSAIKVICGLSSGYVMVDLVNRSTEDIAGPKAIGGIANTSGGRFASVGTASMGYMGLGGYTSKPLATKLADEQILLTKDTNSIFISCEGQILAKKQIPWQQAPEAIGYSYPYILALQSPSQSLLEVRNPETLSLLQSISLPSAKQLHFPPPTVSLAHAGKGFHVASERCIWRMESIDYNSQINGLVKCEEYDEAISILNMLEDALLYNKRERLREIKIQKAQKLFDNKMYQDAIDIFMAQDVLAPPERVIKLFPRVIAGNITAWEEKEPSTEISSVNQVKQKNEDTLGINDNNITCSNETVEPKKSTTARKAFKPQLKGQSDSSSIKSSKRLDDDSRDAPSTIFKSTEGVMEGKDLQNAVLALTGFLVQARNRMKAFLDVETGKIKLIEQINKDDHSQFAFESLLTTPASDANKDREEELRETATLIDTTLFRSYVLAKPQLAGALFRIPNFCDPDVVNEKLLESNRYNDLVDFFYGKKMHRPALELLKRFGTSDSDDSVPEALRGPQRTISYLQNLPPELISLILEFAEWPLRINPDLGMEIFLADTENAETLPRSKVVAFLQSIDENLSIRYLEHIISELGDTTLEFHNRLIAAYLMDLKTKPKNDKKELMNKLIEFMKTSTHYSLGKALDLIPKNNPDFYEAQAVVLSNMGQYKKALEIYVFKTKDYKKAEEYCNHIYVTSVNKDRSASFNSGKPSTTNLIDGNTKKASLSIHHTLLSLYLTPPPPHKQNLPNALQLLSNHGFRLPASSTLSLIPESLPIASLESYLRGRIRTLNSKANESKVVAGLYKSEAISVQATLLLSNGKVSGGTDKISCGERLIGRSGRVVISEDRICPSCHKRLGNSVIAVTPDGTVVHYGCLSKWRSIFGNDNSAVV